MIDSNGRGEGIRTPDPLLPKQMRYQTALRPDKPPSIVARIGFGLLLQRQFQRLAIHAKNHTTSRMGTAKTSPIATANRVRKAQSRQV